MNKIFDHFGMLGCMASYKTPHGIMLQGEAEELLKSKPKELKGKVQLIFTSPPFLLNTKKSYGNLKGEEYLEWFCGLAPVFKRLLKKNGSIVIELGNAWHPGKPIMSPLVLKALINFLEKGGFNLCQQFIYYNKARLPSPVQWVNIERIRVKDSFTHIWWMSHSERPKADNRRVLNDYSASMKKLLERGTYNSGNRPSQHQIGIKSFLTDNKGAIPSNVLSFSNTKSSDEYLKYCRKFNFKPHPARMPVEVAEFFIKFLTTPKELVLDPFAGSNTTGFAAEKLKRKWISVELNESYIESSKGRFQGLML
jgi:DNA modification methylase